LGKQDEENLKNNLKRLNEKFSFKNERLEVPKNNSNLNASLSKNSPAMSVKM
jgi:hypothetical protein